MDDEKSVMDRFRDRIGSLERVFERLDERMSGKLGKDDATRLMEYSADGDNRLREDVGGRINDFRIEVREAFKHGEKEYAAALYKATTELKTELKTEFKTELGAIIATAVAAALPQTPERRGWHPVPVSVGTTALVSALWVVAQLMGLRIPVPG